MRMNLKKHIHLIIITLVVTMMSGPAFGAAKCKSFAHYINMSMRKDVNPSRAYQITKGINEVEKASEVKIYEDGKEIAVTIDKYEDGALLYRRADSDEVLSFDVINDEVRNFFRIDGEGPLVGRAPEIQTELPLGPGRAGNQLELALEGGESSLRNGPDFNRPAVDEPVARAEQPELPGLESQPRQMELDFDAPPRPVEPDVANVQGPELPPAVANADNLPVVKADSPVQRAQTPEQPSAPRDVEPYVHQGEIVRDTDIVVAREAPELEGRIIDLDPSEYADITSSLPVVPRADTPPVVRNLTGPKRLEPIPPERALTVRPDSPAPRPAVRAEAPARLDPIPPERAITIRPKPDTPVVRAETPARLDPVPPEKALTVRPDSPAPTPAVRAEAPERLEPIDIDSLTIKGETPRLPAPEAPVARVIPGEPNFSLARVGTDIEFKSPAGNVTTRGRVVAVNEQSVRIADTNGAERTVRFREIDSESLKVVEPESVTIGRPSTGRVQPSRADFPESRVGDTVTFTTPAGNRTVTGEIVRINNQSVRLRINGKEETFRFRNINGDSIVFQADNLPAVTPAREVALSGRGVEKVEPEVLEGEIIRNTDVVPSGETPRLEGRVIDLDASDYSEVAENLPTLRRETAPATRGTNLETFTHRGEIVEPTDVARRVEPSGSLEGPVIDGTARVVNEGRDVAAQTARNIPTRVAGVPDELSPFFRAGQNVSFRTKTGREVSGVFEGIEDGKALIRLEDGTVIRLGFDEINSTSITSKLSPHSATPEDLAKLVDDNSEVTFGLGDDLAEAAAKSTSAASRAMRFFERLGAGPFRVLDHGRGFVRVVSKTTGKVKRIPLSVLRRNGITMNVRRVAGVSPELSRALGRYYRTLDEDDENPGVDNGSDAPGTTTSGDTDDPGPSEPTNEEDPDASGEEADRPSNDEPFQEITVDDEDVIDENEFLPSPGFPQQGPGMQGPQPIPQHKSGIQIKRGVF